MKRFAKYALMLLAALVLLDLVYSSFLSEGEIVIEAIDLSEEKVKPASTFLVVVTYEDYEFQGQRFDSTDALIKRLETVSGQPFGLMLMPCASERLVIEVREYLQTRQPGLHMLGSTDYDEALCPNA